MSICRSPSAIIIENLDILAPSKSSGDKRSSNFAQSLVSLVPTLSKLKSSTRVVIFASATDIDSVDSGLRSPRIFGKEIDLPVPSRKEREQILRTILSKISHKFSNDEISGKMFVDCVIVINYVNVNAILKQKLLVQLMVLWELTFTGYVLNLFKLLLRGIRKQAMLKSR